MKTILHLSSQKKWGGGEEQLTSLCKNLNALKLSNNIIFCVKNSVLSKKANQQNLSYVEAPLSFNLDLRYVFQLIKTIKKNNISLVHIHDSSAMTLALMANYFYNMPPMVFSKKTIFPIKNRKFTLYKYNHPKIKKIFCDSQNVLKITNEAIKNPDRLKVIYDGIEIPENNFLTKNLREEYKISSEKTLVGNIGNHSDAKDLNTFIETVNLLVNKKNKLNFVFIQIGRFSKQTPLLLEKIKRYKLENHLFFLGEIPNASSLISQLDIFLMTSKQEGMPLVIYESFYLKTPVISTKAGGISEVIEHNENGLLSQIGDAENLTENLILLQNNKALKEKFTNLSHQKMLQNFTSQTMATNTQKAYDSLF